MQAVQHKLLPVRLSAHVVAMFFAVVAGRVTLADEPAGPPTLYIIGDSTVKNGRGNGDRDMWGWGQVLAPHFDAAKIRVDNRAIGGRSSRTFVTEGRWDDVLDDLRPGDFVLIQFGHNDGAPLFEGDRPRGSIPGHGDETEDGVVALTGKPETVHTYGWYLRRFIADAKAKGATPIVLSPVPRDVWRSGRVVRADKNYGRWAAEAARQGGAPFVDLNEIVAAHYERAGEEAVRRDYFTTADHTHTSRAGAELNAECVVEGIRTATPDLAALLAASSGTSSATKPQ
jgi:rhamnogalacturonan acetylesterase